MGAHGRVPAESEARSRGAEDFLELVERGRRGRLKLYIGFAAGVGKTYRMLEEAHALRQRGVDVVRRLRRDARPRRDRGAHRGAGGGAARKVVTYRGVAVEEMDLDAVLARKPAGGAGRRAGPHQRPRLRRNRKRYQDVEELLDAGINVIGAFNVQHLESLNDIVERATGVRVRETVPDSFLKQADQVVNLDLAVEDLHERLQGGQDLRAGQGAAGAGELLPAGEPLHAARAGAARGGREPGPRHAGRAARGARSRGSSAAAGAG